MKLSICTISFRHHLHSLDQIAHWAQKHDFQGIELWGIHAKNLADEPHYGADWLNAYGLETSMLSDYLPLEASESDLLAETKKLSQLAKHWGTKKIRTFVGKKGSAQTTKMEREDLIEKLQLICEYLYSEGQSVLVETHPNTLADNVASTIQLLEEANHPALRINFDVLHVWESGINPLEAMKQLGPYVSHFHFKNIASRSQLDVFSPNNVYAAAGSRKGMVSLFEGAVNYQEFLEKLIPTMDVQASLEWFGPNVKEVLEKDGKQINEIIEAMKVRKE
ncbi:sugar phosphate isomerase/epimerase [Metabacillus litoralis]|uniref:sugar phosphate isomerase/epimerase family protein n=1 Tax=Metabacillus TaxID=2675233 RepID=UPI001B8E1920|nr:sugar phosphate isomerase/epimerase [Metabacillus litoralis]MCM3410260.1 sugar phosphate isomerase/epimerase [Metabacillus litoralis]UHA61666.1 sugar phosphate isomerase/epimerase [Metabacillus litoralis]